MKEQLLKLYPDVAPSRVTVTGTPQFDFHRRAAYRKPRADTLSMLGIPKDARYVASAAGNEALMPDEVEVVAELARRMEADKELAAHWLVVRLHPLDDGGRWREALIHLPKVKLSSAWESEPESDGWILLNPEDQARLVSTISHSDACIN